MHHLRLVQATFGKDLHGMRGRDLDHKEKQNYDAVVHIISKSVEDLLAKVPDSNGTIAYLSVIRSVVESFLNKELPLTARIEKAWYAVFFLRYWRAWLVSQPGYKLENNFVTRNAYICIEMNAHSLVTLARTMRDASTTGNECFPPWMLGSQSCEKLFRAARSMTPTFSTVVNFGMLGLFRRLHRMHIQSCLEAESTTTGIHFPRVDKHKQKDGHNSPSCSTSCLQDGKIEELVKKAEERARK